MSKKHTIKFIKQYFEDRNCELYETEYKNCHTLMKYRCKCGNKKCKISFKNFKNGQRCMICGGKEKHTFEYIYNYFKDRNCELYETEYINNSTLMRYRCICGNPNCKITFNSFKNGSRCMECSGNKKHTFKFVKQYFEDRDCELYETEYINCMTKMRYRCDCGNTKCKISFNSFKAGGRCNKCGLKRQADKTRLIFKEVKQYFEDRNCELYETEYINNHTLMKYRCDCGNKKCKICFSSFKQGHRCRECYLKRNSGKNNHFYNPDLTDEEREKSRKCPGYNKWRTDVRERDNDTCQICGETEGTLCVHHIEAYKPNKELRVVLSNGILFCEKHHIEFHKIYGNDCNREQLEDFLITEQQFV